MLHSEVVLKSWIMTSSLTFQVGTGYISLILNDIIFLLDKSYVMSESFEFDLTFICLNNIWHIISMPSYKHGRENRQIAEQCMKQLEISLDLPLLRQHTQHGTPR
jgi:hypothetical protein